MKNWMKVVIVIAVVAILCTSLALYFVLPSLIVRLIVTHICVGTYVCVVEANEGLPQWEVGVELEIKANGEAILRRAGIPFLAIYDYTIEGRTITLTLSDDPWPTFKGELKGVGDFTFDIIFPKGTVFSKVKKND